MKSFHNQKRRNLQSKRAFTLLELLVVITILGVLVALGLRSFLASQMKARDSKRKGEVEQLSKALEMFWGDQGYYPVGNDLGQIMMQNSESSWTIFEWGEEFYDVNNPSTIYMTKLPGSGNIKCYYQAYRLAGGSFEAVDNNESEQAHAYQIYTHIENLEDQSMLQVETGLSCGAASCNYVIMSVNLPENSVITQ